MKIEDIKKIQKDIREKGEAMRKQLGLPPRLKAYTPFCPH